MDFAAVSALSVATFFLSLADFWLGAVIVYLVLRLLGK